MDLTLNGITLASVLVTLIVSLSIHEAMHAYVSLKLGDTTAYEGGRVSFNPLRHIDPFATILMPIITLVLFHVPFLAAKPVPFNPYRLKYQEMGVALVGLAGPFSNLILALLGDLLLHSVSSALLVTFFSTFVIVNVAIFVFNMIPIPPLDGSRLLYALAPESLQNVLAKLETYGFFIIITLVIAVPGFTNFLVTLNNFVLHLLP